MDIIRSVTQTVLGSPQASEQSSGAFTVERLLDRVQSSSLLDDRRDGCRALKALSRKYRLHVGAHGMDTLIQVLELDRSDHEIVNYALETLINITTTETFEEEVGSEEDRHLVCSQRGHIGEQFTEIFTKRTENVALIISLLDEFDFRVRYPAMKLLNNLLENRPKDVQEAILVIPSGVSRIMDQLADSREVIRNDSLLLLTRLTSGNTNLQKIVAFENAFDHLFDITHKEGYSEGGIIVEDCLTLMLSLLRNNPSNQNLFKEGVYIPKLKSFFELPIGEIGWSAQKITNVHYMLQLVRTLVSPQNSAQVVTLCQKKMRASGLLETLCDLLMAVGVPADILTDTIITVSDLIRGNQENQEFFSTIMAPSTPPRPAIVVLLMSMVNNKQPFSLRCAVLYCFQCYLCRNQTSQAQVVHTLLPQTADASQITAGQLLCGGLFSSDPVSTWFSAVALSHALLDNPVLKEQLLRVQLATSVGSPPVSLLQQCAALLQSSPKLLTRLGVLQLLCTWVAHSPIAVAQLLMLGGAVPYLTAHVSANEHDDQEVICQGLCAFLLALCAQFNDGSVEAFSREGLVQLISDRVGIETFASKLENIISSEPYSKAAKSPLLSARHLQELILDHEFCRLFKALEASALRTVSPQLVPGGQANGDVSPEEVNQYKGIIREQDVTITSLRMMLHDTTQRLDSLEAEKNSLAKQLNHLQGERTAVRSVDAGSSCEVSSSRGALSAAVSSSSKDEGTCDQLAALHQQLTEMTYARDYYYFQMVEKEAQLQKMATKGSSEGKEGSDTKADSSGGLRQNTSSASGEATDSASVEIANLMRQLQDLQLVLHQRDEQIQQLQDAASLAQSKKEMTVRNDQSSLEEKLSRAKEEKADLEKKLTEVQQKQATLQEKATYQEDMANEWESKFRRLQTEFLKMQSEQEDLLVLLTEQEGKMADMRQKLKGLGYPASEDDEEEEGLDLDFESLSLFGRPDELNP